MQSFSDQFCSWLRHVVIRLRRVEGARKVDVSCPRLGSAEVSVASRPRRRMSRRDFIIGGSRRRLQAAGVRFRPGVAEAQRRTVRFTDGSTLAVGTVVWATGYRSDYSWIGIPGVARDGTAIHRRGATKVPGLYLLGLSSQHTRGSALLGFVRDDAAYLASRITTTASAAQPAPPAGGVSVSPGTAVVGLGHHG